MGINFNGLNKLCGLRTRSCFILLAAGLLLLAGCSQPHVVQTDPTTTTTNIVSATSTTTTMMATVTSTTMTTTTTTLAVPNIVLKGEINATQDSMGHIEFLGEMQNIGNASATYIFITFTMKDSSGLVIDTTLSYLVGTVLELGSYTDNHCLRPGEYGAFDATTNIPYASVDSYSYVINWHTNSTSTPEANLEFFGLINDIYEPYSGNKKYLGELKNNSSRDTTWATVYFIMKNIAGKVIGIAWSYVSGLDIAAGQVKSFKVVSNVPSNEVSSYYNRFYWQE